VSVGSDHPEAAVSLCYATGTGNMSPANKQTKISTNLKNNKTYTHSHTAVLNNTMVAESTRNVSQRNIN
jgi:hypothetical protein